MSLNAKKIAVFVASWLLLGLIFTVQSYLFVISLGSPFKLSVIAIQEIGTAFVYGMCFLPIRSVARKFSFERGHLLKSIGVHVVVYILFSLVIAFSYIGLRELAAYIVQGKPLGLGMKFEPLFFLSFSLSLSFLIYVLFIGAEYFMQFYRKYRSQQEATVRLESELSKAKLTALRNQLQPHFLFNTLNTISSLVYENPSKADHLISKLSELLRSILQESGEHEVLLSTELELVKKYVEIAEVRFSDRLEVKFHIDEETLDSRVPYLLLQPLVENAIRYTVNSDKQRCLVSIDCRRRNGVIHIAVRDNGVGFNNDEQVIFGLGLGLSNVKTRLEQLYGARHVLRLLNNKTGGASVEIEIPQQTSTQYAADDA